MGFEQLLDQTEAKALLKGYLRTGRIANAYLFSGAEGVGKRSGAFLLAQALNCATGEACGVCASCQDMQARRHPDLTLVEPERGSLSIGIDQIRAVKTVVSLKSYRGGYKVVVIAQADRMTQEAANALLKTLEEPPDRTTLILTTSKPDFLPRTIVSRCQRVAFGLIRQGTIQKVLMDRFQIAPKEAELWSTLAAGRLGVAIREAEDGRFKLREATLAAVMKIIRGEESPVSVAEAMAGVANKTQDAMKREGQATIKRLREEHPEIEMASTEEKIEAGVQARYRGWLEELLDSFTVWFRDALVYAVARDEKIVINRDHLHEIQEIVDALPKRRLFEILATGFTVRGRLAANVQIRFLFEKLFFHIAEDIEHD